MMKRLKYLTLATLVAFAACDEGADPVDEPVTGSVTVSASAEGENVDGATVTLTGEGTSQSQTTSGGTATFPSVVEGSYVVSLSGIPSDYVFGNTTQTTNVTAAQPDATVSFTGQIVRTASISGQVTASGTGVEGVEITIDGPEGTEVQSTNPSGNYVFSGLRSGSYTVTITGNPDEERFTFNTTESTIDLGVGEAGVVNFGGVETVPGSISGTVTASGQGVEGATVTIDGPETASKQTSGAGNYQFTELTPGTYTVTLTNPDEELYECLTLEVTVELASGEAEIVDFGCTLVPDPQVTIEQITQNGTSVDRDNIMGIVDVVVNVRRRGAVLTNVDLMARDQATGEIYLVDRETFVQAAPPEEQLEEDDAVDVSFQWRTDAIRRLNGSHPSVTVTEDLADPFEAIDANPARPYHPLFVNGNWDVWARIESENADPVSALVDVILNNEDALNLGITADNTNWENPGPAITNGKCDEQPDNFFPSCLIESTQGLRWLSGDIEITVFPIIYSQAYDPNDPLLQRGAFMFDGFLGGADTPFGGTELLAPNNTVNNTFRFTFCELGGATAQNGDACYASIAQLNTGFIGARNVMVQTKTEFGQFGPGINNLKSISLFDTELQSGTGVINDVLRIDNESPVPGTMDASNLPHPANAAIGVDGFVRSGIGGAFNAGWFNWTDVISSMVDDTNSDIPNTVPDLDKNMNDPTQFCDPAGNCLTADGTVGLMGIGLPGSTNNRPNLVFVQGPDIAPDPTSCLPPGTTTAQRVANIIANADIESIDPITGADLPPETGSPGLDDAGSAEGTPFSDRECDYGMTAQHWDLFGNIANAENYLMLGVDGRAPIYSNSAGTTDPDNSLSLVDPTSAGSVYNTYDDDFYDLDLRPAAPDDATFGNSVWNSTTTGAAPFNLGKTKGAYEGFTTDRGNGFSGVAGVVVEDWESRCATGSLACSPFDQMDTRWGFTLQPQAPGGSAVVLPFRFDGQTDIDPAGGDTFIDVAEAGRIPVHTVGVPFRAYVATQDVASPHDGYRDHMMHTWDRAGNDRTDDNASEGNADHTMPNVGNVQMPTVVTFDVDDDYTFLGENLDNVDLRKSDFSFDFNSILSLQVYSSPAATSHPNQAGPTPPNDIDAVPYEETSLQLPLNNVPHTAFGSQDIFLGGNLSITTEFLACLVRADEYGLATVVSQSDPAGSLADADVGGAEPRVHRPRGPRWRTWDHSSEYGLVNTQFNTFVPSSIPACLTPAEIATNFVPALGQVGPGVDGVLGTPDDGSGPDGVFGTQDDDASWTFITNGNRPTITFKGPAGNFVPNINPNEDILLYYLDTAGRAQLLENSAFSLIVSDLGTGAFGRWYEYTLTNPVPDNLIDNANAPANGTVDGWFVVVRGNGVNGNKGHGVIWDETANPAGMVAFDPLLTDGTVAPAPGGNAGIFQFMALEDAGYLVQANAAADLVLRVNPILNNVSVADGEFIGLSEQEFIGFVAPEAGAITVSTDANPGEVNAQACVVSQAVSNGAPLVVTLDDATDCKLQPGPGAALFGGNQLNAQFVQVDLAEGATYTFELTAGGLADPAMILLSPEGLPVASRNEETDIGDPDETMTYTPIAGGTGTYVLMVHGGFSVAGDDGAVTLEVTN